LVDEDERVLILSSLIDSSSDNETISPVVVSDHTKDLGKIENSEPVS
jgi:hypothetical protein